MKRKKKAIQHIDHSVNLCNENSYFWVKFLNGVWNLVFLHGGTKYDTNGFIT